MPDKTLLEIAELEKTIADLEEENRIYSGVINMTNPDYYDDLIDKNNEKISELKAKVEKLKKTVKLDDDDEKKAETDKVRADLKELKDKLYNYRMGVYTMTEDDYKFTVEAKLEDDIREYIRNYKGILSKEELEAIDAEYSVDARLKDELGEELATFAEETLVYFVGILKDLHAADYGTPQYDRARTNFEIFLEKAQKLDGNHNISVSFDEKTQEFTMDFDGKLPRISKQVVNNGAVDAINKAAKKGEPENVIDKYEADFKALVDVEISKLKGHFKGTARLSEAELVNAYQSPNREDYDGLSDKMADFIDSTAIRGYRFSLLTGSFNMELAYIIDFYIAILSIKEEMTKVAVGSEEFKELEEKLKYYIDQIKVYDSEEIKVEYDEDNYFLKVTVKDGKIDDLVVPENFIEAQVVSNLTLAEIRKASKKPEPLTTEEKMLREALMKPTIKYMIWFEKVLTLQETYDAATKERELDKVKEVLKDKKFDSISEERKQEILKQVLADREQYVIGKYGKELYDLLVEFAISYRKKADRLKAATYGTPEFDDALRDVQELIEKARKVPDVVVKYNEDNQNLSIEFPKGIDAIFATLVSKETLEAMNKDRKTNPDIEEQFKADFKAEYKKYYDCAERHIKTHKYAKELDQIYKQLMEYVDSYSGLSSERKKEIADEISNEYIKELCNKYGNDIERLVDLIDDLQETIEELKHAKYGTPEFDDNKDEFDSLLDELKGMPGVRVTYNEDNQTLSITFDNLEIEEIFDVVVSKEALEEMQKAKATGDPKADPKSDSKPEPPSKDIQAAIDEYLARVQEINNMVDELERLDLMTATTTDPLSVAYMDAVIEHEKLARNYESEINNNRFELSKYRMDFTKKYGKYIFSYPEVKNTPIREVNYKESLEDITKKVDEIIIRAEYERTRDNIDQSEIAKINEYIDAQNAMISRRLINRVANDSSYNSKDYLETRRKDKQAQRKEILQREKGPEFIENYTIKGSTLNFNPTVRDKIDTSKAVVISATDQINVELYKSRIVIKMTKQVKDRLAKLKTAIKLTNKHGIEQVVDVNKNKAIEFGANGEDLTGLGLEVVSQDPSITDEAMYSMDLEELKTRSK